MTVGLILIMLAQAQAAPAGLFAPKGPEPVPLPVDVREFLLWRSNCAAWMEHLPMAAGSGDRLTRSKIHLVRGELSRLDCVHAQRNQVLLERKYLRRPEVLTALQSDVYTQVQ